MFRTGIALFLLIVLVLSVCVPSRLDLHRLDGYTGKEEHFDPEGFLDYVDYCKYYYPSAEAFAASERYAMVTEGDIEVIRGYFENFAGRMRACSREQEYDFDPACISPGDYFDVFTMEGEPIDSRAYRKYDNYDVYFFDVESCTLYYIHSNI